MPPRILDSAFAIRIPRVSAFLPDVTQQIHSLRAKGVMPSHSARVRGSDWMARRRSAGRLCTGPAREPVLRFGIVLTWETPA